MRHGRNHFPRKTIIPYRMKALIWVALSVALPVFSSAQSTPQKDTIPVIDMRGYDPDKALMAAIKNSRNDVVVVLVRGADEELFTKTKAQMNALVHQGHTRVGIVRCNIKEGEVGAVLCIPELLTP